MDTKSYNESQVRRATARRQAMQRYRAKGMTLAAIGRRFGGITPQRVQQILKPRGDEQP